MYSTAISFFALKEIVIDAKNSTISVAKQMRDEILDRPTSNFSKLLNIIPGATTINIGAGVAKSVIRGQSFNRVAVINQGIAQQNQQWGADHGMEINQFDMQFASVYKGTNSLLWNSSGLPTIEIEPYKFKNRDFFSGEIIALGASNNDLLGTAITTQWQKGKWYLRGSYNYQDYADYKVPVNTAIHDGSEIALSNKRISNTAGKEQSVSGIIGLKEKNITTYFTVTNNYQKTGFFEGGHEHEHEDEDHNHEEVHSEDTSYRNIGMPYATSNHFTITNNTEWKTSLFRLLVNTGYQKNHRREFEHFHEHYEGQSVPSTDDDIAVDFKLQTYSSNARLYMDEKKKWKKIIGASAEYQQNRVAGFEFFLPRYNQVTGGLSFVNNFELSDQFILDAGIRYDLGHIAITGFYDNELANHLEEKGYEPSIVKEYAQRAYNVNRNFGNWSGNIEARYLYSNDLTLKANIGKSLRFPSANELGANGLHHAAFRYEIGDPGLKPEHGYTLDLEVDYHYNKLNMDFTPFFSYYSNFIYLQAIDNQAIMLYDEQPYKYSQAKTIYGGAEYNIKWQIIKKLEISSNGSLVLNKIIDTHAPLPFTPPFAMRNEVKFMNEISKGKLSYYQISVSHQLFAKQSRVGTGEKETAGANLFNLSAGFDYKFSPKCNVIFNVQVQNIFNTSYMNHMSLYRRLDIPEPGRNVQLFIRIPFGN